MTTIEDEELIRLIAQEPFARTSSGNSAGQISGRSMSLFAGSLSRDERRMVSRSGRYARLSADAVLDSRTQAPLWFEYHTAGLMNVGWRVDFDSVRKVVRSNFGGSLVTGYRDATWDIVNPQVRALTAEVLKRFETSPPGQSLFFSNIEEARIFNIMPVVHNAAGQVELHVHFVNLFVKEWTNKFWFWDIPERSAELSVSIARFVLDKQRYVERQPMLDKALMDFAEDELDF